MASTYLYRSATGQSTQKFTFSCWFKRSNTLASGNNYLFSHYADSSNRISIALVNDTFIIYAEASGSEVYQKKTNRLLRDNSAWYHAVVAVDTTQSTGSNRVRLYINGVEETSFATDNVPTVNATTPAAATHYVGSYTASSNFFDGYMNHVAFVDGTQLTPSNFGETDTASGIWKWKSPSGVTWGDNGFHLKFDNDANLGLDSSGETNNFTLGGNGKQAKDNPTLSNTTYNALAQKYTSGTSYSNGNLTTTNTSSVGQRMAISTFGVETGKWYAEFKLVAIGSTSGSKPYVGVCSQRDYVGNTYVGSTPGCGLHTGGDIYYAGAGPTSTGTSYTTGDIIGVALDVTNSLIYWHKNGTYISNGSSGIGNPTTGANGFNFSTVTAKGGIVGFATSLYDNGGSWSANFGNGYFGTTKITSAGSNGNGSLFEYDVPSGYYALNTKNLNTYG